MPNILDGAPAGADNEFEAHTLSITVADIPGVLNHVCFVLTSHNIRNFQALFLANDDRSAHYSQE